MIAGVDTASNRLQVVSSGGVVLGDFGPFKSEPDVRRKQLHFDAVHVFGRLQARSHVFCEEPLALKNGKTTRLLGLAAGAIWAGHLRYDIFWHWVDVAAWKKSQIGKGNATKDEIREWCRSEGFYSDVEDLNDAYAIARHGASLLAEAGIEA